MARLVYSAMMSVDGYIANENGNFDWAAPDDEVHQFANDIERRIGTHLYGRRMYEVMSAWETIRADGETPPVMLEYAEIWQAAEKIVYSRTLKSVSSDRTRIERAFDPEAVGRMKLDLSQDISISGANLGAQAFQSGLVDECHFFIAPVVVGGGTKGLPDAFRLNLELLDERRFSNGMVYLYYRCEA